MLVETLLLNLLEEFIVIISSYRHLLFKLHFEINRIQTFDLLKDFKQVKEGLAYYFDMFKATGLESYTNFTSQLIILLLEDLIDSVHDF